MDIEIQRSAEELQQRVQELEAQRKDGQRVITDLVARLDAAQDEINGLQIALTNSRQISAALGIVMATHKVTMEEAFNILRIMSQHCHRKLRDVAADVILTGAVRESL